MKTTLRNLFLMVAFSYVIETGISCAAAAVAIFIPLLGANPWVNTAVPNAENTFFFLVDTDKSNTSTFTGNENLPNGGGQAPFKGSFTNHDIQFTYDNTRTTKKGTYTGYINDASTQIDLTGTNGLPAITLKKQ